MNNICIQITARDLKKMLEEHLRQSLAANKRAVIRMVTSTCDPITEPGQPNMGVSVTFDVVDV